MEYVEDLDRQFGITQEPYGLALNELAQAEETGHDVGDQRRRFEALAQTDEAELTAVYESLPLQPPPDSPHFEGSALADILAELPDAESTTVDPDRLTGQLKGAWYGRVAGNMLGKPVELGWPRARLAAYLADLDALPLRDYIPIPDLSPEALDRAGFIAAGHVPYERLARGSVDGGVRDDDVDYTILGLHLLETYGRDYRTYDVAFEWLHRLPIYQTYTAERAAYNNLVREVPLESAGEFHNPFREWIGALIRADAFGYVHPGDPRSAAVLAYNDAYLSHRANGIYGEMWAAALVASAFTATSPIDSIERSLQHVPPMSRLAVEILAVLADHRAGLDWNAAMDRQDERLGAMSWVHTINNAGALAAAILWGDGDFSATIALAVLAGLDTDSIGATAGSWAGIVAGFDGIPSHWIEPLHGTTRSALFGYAQVDLDGLVARTARLINK